MYLLHIDIEIIQQMVWDTYWDIDEIFMIISHKVICDLQTWHMPQKIITSGGEQLYF